ncbi:MAG TPA: N-acetylmuramoyl-L-alanine amidase [Thermoanaerobaculia bacterium]|nr:N-acetylmuramoyl-L-alanine amidase [Thermoanaerobaculia bacterium]
MKDRRIWALLPFLCLLLPMLVAAQGGQPQAPPPAARPTVVLEGREIAVPVALAGNGPTFGLTPLAEALGGTLSTDASGESVSLKIADKEVVIGQGNAIITVGDAIVSLSQPPVQGEGGLQVPLDFLRKTFGDLLGYSFDWRPETQRLTIARRGSRDLPVSLDVVHLQGMTTIVLSFPEEPRYKLNRQGSLIQVQMLADRLTPPAPKEIQDPLVQGVTIDPGQIRLQLAEGAQAESYVLEKPFRLVFDVHRTSEVEVPTSPNAPTERQSGIHTIVIDPGHGGVEVGAIGPSGIQEKELTLQLARELEAKLAQRLGVRVVLTRTEDALVPLDMRPAIANQNKADLFISIHLNSSLGSGAYGTETYFLSPQATDNRASTSAAAENREAGGGAATSDAAGSTASSGNPADDTQDLQLILWDLAQTHHLGESQRFANMIQGELNEMLKLKDRGVKQAPFRVLMGATMPAVLVELGFISNPDEEKKLKDVVYREQLVDALSRAVAHYKALVENRPEIPTATPPAAGTAPQATPSPAPAGTPVPAAKPPAKGHPA